MQISISILVGNANSGISYVKKLIKAFKARVLSYPTSIFEAEPCLDTTLAELNAIGLLKDASLIITPNAYNEGILYDVVPNTTLGDMTVVRATTATRVNSAGLIEVVPRNLVTYSEQFENAIWIKQSSTIVQDFAIAPNGIGNADLCYPTSSGSFRGFRQASTTSIGLRAKSIFAKQSGKSKFYIRFDNTAYVTFDLANGSIFQNTTGYAATIEDYGNGWYRCNAVNNIEPSTTSMYIGLSDSSGYASVTVNGTDGVLFWGAQDEEGSTATEYFPTTTRLNIPRIDYTNGSCPSLLVEPQRTNLALYSEQFDNASWPKLATTIIPNTETSPSNVINSDTLIADGSLNTHLFAGTFAVTSGVTYTISIFVKKNTNNFFQIYGSGIIWGNNFFANFDLENGVLGTVGSSAIASIENIQNQWYRCSIRGTALVSGATFSTAFSLITSANSPRAQQNTLSTSVFIWGAQLEAGSNATSYIPTVASTVTRNADVISKTGISSLIGQTEGTVYTEAYFTYLNNSVNRAIVNLFSTDADSNNIIRVRFSGNSISFDIRKLGVIQSIINYPITTLKKYKIAIVYKSNYASLFIDGVKIGEDLTVDIPTTSFIMIGSFNSSGLESNNMGINLIAVWKTALTDQELISLTTI